MQNRFSHFFLLLTCFLFTAFAQGQVGTLDLSFNTVDTVELPSTLGPEGAITGLAVDANGKILFIGTLTAFNEVPVKGIVRLNSDYTVDRTFDTQLHPFDTIFKIGVQSDGKVILLGRDGAGDKKILRLLNDGSVDVSFGETLYQSGTNYDLYVDSTDQVLYTDGQLKRLDQDGGVDAVFDANASVLGLCQVKAEYGGSYYVEGGMLIQKLKHDGNVDSSFSTFDASFAFDFLGDIKLIPGEKLILGGKVDHPSLLFHANSKVVVLSSTGTEDKTYSLDSTLNLSFSQDEVARSVSQFVVKQDGSILSVVRVTELKYVYTGITYPTYDRVVHLSSTGLPISHVDLRTSNYIQSGAEVFGKLLIVGLFDDYGIAINSVAGYQAGSITNPLSYLHKGGGSGSVYSIGSHSDSIFIGGLLSFYNGNEVFDLAQLNFDGSFNKYISTDTIHDPSSFIGTPHLLCYADKVIYSKNKYQVGYLFRMNRNGSIDSSFTHGKVEQISMTTDWVLNTQKKVDGLIESLTIDFQGRIVVGAYNERLNLFDGPKVWPNYSHNPYRPVGAASRSRSLNRLFPNGAFDTTFYCNTYGTIFCTASQPDGKIIVGCSEKNIVDTSYYKYLFRVNNDGSLDTNFHQGTGLNGRLRDIEVLPDGKILLAGDFTEYNGQFANHLTRLNADGTLDKSFTPGTGPNYPVECMAIQSDGKILLGGYFYSYDGTMISKICRINEDGTFDDTFNPGGFGANAGVRAIAIQEDGNILIGGDFTTYNGVPRTKIARLIGDAPQDTCALKLYFTDVMDYTCNGSLATATVNIKHAQGASTISWIGQGTTFTSSDSVAIFNQEDVYSCTVTDNVGCSKTISLKIEDCLPDVGVEEVINTVSASLYPNPSTGTFTVLSLSEIQELQVYDQSGRVSQQSSPLSNKVQLNLEGHPAGIYPIRIKTTDGVAVLKAVIQ